MMRSCLQPCDMTCQTYLGLVLFELIIEKQLHRKTCILWYLTYFKFYVAPTGSFRDILLKEEYSSFSDKQLLSRKVM